MTSTDKRRKQLRDAKRRQRSRQQESGLGQLNAAIKLDLLEACRAALKSGKAEDMNTLISNSIEQYLTGNTVEGGIVEEDVPPEDLEEFYIIDLIQDVFSLASLYEPERFKHISALLEHSLVISDLNRYVRMLGYESPVTKVKE